MRAALCELAPLTTSFIVENGGTRAGVVLWLLELETALVRRKELRGKDSGSGNVARQILHAWTHTTSDTASEEAKTPISAEALAAALDFIFSASAVEDQNLKTSMSAAKGNGSPTEGRDSKHLLTSKLLGVR